MRVNSLSFSQWVSLWLYLIITGGVFRDPDAQAALKTNRIRIPEAVIQHQHFFKVPFVIQMCSQD